MGKHWGNNGETLPNLNGIKRKNLGFGIYHQLPVNPRIYRYSRHFRRSPHHPLVVPLGLWTVGGFPFVNRCLCSVGHCIWGNIWLNIWFCSHSSRFLVILDYAGSLRQPIDGISEIVTGLLEFGADLGELVSDLENFF